MPNFPWSSFLFQSHKFWYFPRHSYFLTNPKPFTDPEATLNRCYWWYSDDTAVWFSRNIGQVNYRNKKCSMPLKGKKKILSWNSESFQSNLYFKKTSFNILALSPLPGYRVKTRSTIGAGHTSTRGQIGTNVLKSVGFPRITIWWEHWLKVVCPFDAFMLEWFRIWEWTCIFFFF